MLKKLFYTTLVLFGVFLLAFNVYQLNNAHQLNIKINALIVGKDSLLKQNQELKNLGDELNIALEEEKNKPPEIVTKVVEKRVEVPVNNTNKYKEIAREELIKQVVKNAVKSPTHCTTFSTGTVGSISCY